jgi:hypothetical protein
MATDEFTASKASATRAEIGSTVDEPEITIWPDRPVPPPVVVDAASSPPQATATKPITSKRAPRRRVLRTISFVPPG